MDSSNIWYDFYLARDSKVSNPVYSLSETQIKCETGFVAGSCDSNLHF
jgi:hypothetical protein